MAIVDSTSTDQLLGIKIYELDKLKEKGADIEYKPLLNVDGGKMLEYSIYNENNYQWTIQRFEIQKTKTNKDIGIIFSYVERKKITTEQPIEKIKLSKNEKMVNYVTEMGETTLPKVILED